MSTSDKRIDPAAEKAAFVKRAEFAYWHIVAERRGLSQSELGRRVGERIGESYKQPTVAGWLKGSLPNSVAGMIALAQELGVDPGWLYFGEASQAPAPAGYVPQEPGAAGQREGDRHTKASHLRAALEDEEELTPRPSQQPTKKKRA